MINNKPLINDDSHLIHLPLQSLELQYQTICKRILKIQKHKSNLLSQINDSFFSSFIDSLCLNKQLQSDLKSLFIKLFCFLYVDYYDNLLITNHIELTNYLIQCSKNIHSLNDSNTESYISLQTEYKSVENKYLNDPNPCLKNIFDFFDYTFQEIDLSNTKTNLLSDIEELRRQNYTHTNTETKKKNQFKLPQQHNPSMVDNDSLNYAVAPPHITRSNSNERIFSQNKTNNNTTNNNNNNLNLNVNNNVNNTNNTSFNPSFLDLTPQKNRLNNSEYTEVIFPLRGRRGNGNELNELIVQKDSSSNICNKCCSVSCT